MATLKELMGDLTRGDGRKFYPYKDNRHFEPIFLDKQGFWWGLDENQEQYGFKETCQVRPGPEPKKVKLYRYILKNTHTNLYTVNHWQSERPGNYHYDYKVVGTEEMEVEVDE